MRSLRLRQTMALFVLVGAVTSCSRGPAPPAPTEDLTATVVGVIDAATTAPPFVLRGRARFAPPPGASVERVKNWPGTATSEPDEPTSGLLLLGGQRTDGSWWYELAGFGDGPNQDGCWLIYGGSFDVGDAVVLSSGLRLPKAPSFEIRAEGHDDVDWFPGHQDDAICVDEQGRAVYFQAFIGK
jgi:hypothetical protein